MIFRDNPCDHAAPPALLPPALDAVRALLSSVIQKMLSVFVGALGTVFASEKKDR
jgi:hypothetical protein